MEKVFFYTDNAKTTILIRLMVGAVFLASLFLLIKGCGRWSLDRQLMLRKGGEHR